MEASELTTWVMALLNQASNGAAGAIGGAAGAEAARLMRERLGSSPEGRAALDPGSGDSGETERQVAAALAADAVFARRLEQLYEAARRSPTGAQQAGRDINQAHIGDRSKHNTISFGPLTVRKGSRTPATVALMLLAVALVMGLASYGLTKVLGGDDQATRAPSAGAGANGSDVPAAGSGSEADKGGGQGHKAVPIKDLDLLKKILPDVSSMPSGWSLSGKANVQEATTDNSCRGGECKGLRGLGEVVYTDPGASTKADIAVEAFDSARTAAEGYKRWSEGAGKEGGDSPMSLGSIGDESVAFSGQESNGSATKFHMETIARAGTVMIYIVYGGGDRPLDPAVLTRIARMVAERARQAQNAEQPSATFAETR
ncbi:hypothetical protein [Streptomyces sp. NBC_00083]|uniref:hypothetical protein n=1 Tax=Streptomyces sp. NBC_00083 TaxID=2975647 RepID=UPI00224EA93C|nr:hypothetical protein [Streptomyces sp. NBC_00083]MCX5384714.1 hypothetical protein [Streptomyces sp. NBC_00083]